MYIFQGNQTFIFSQIENKSDYASLARRRTTLNKDVLSSEFDESRYQIQFVFEYTKSFASFWATASAAEASVRLF